MRFRSPGSQHLPGGIEKRGLIPQSAVDEPIGVFAGDPQALGNLPVVALGAAKQDGQLLLGGHSRQGRNGSASIYTRACDYRIVTPGREIRNGIARK
jgi:hypothetical protein